LSAVTERHQPCHTVDGWTEIIGVAGTDAHAHAQAQAVDAREILGVQCALRTRRRRDRCFELTKRNAKSVADCFEDKPAMSIAGRAHDRVVPRHCRCHRLAV
jgi:hypothetical protein